MDTTQGNVTPKEMLEKIAELDYNQSQLKSLNAEMRQWLDVADDEVATLRSENVILRKQLNTLEKIISEAEQNEVETCRPSLADGIDAKICSEKKIEKLEEELTLMKERNEKLTADLKNLQQERDQEKLSQRKSIGTLQTLEWGLEEAQLRLQHKDEILHQKDLLLKHAEETLEEYSNTIEDLRMTNQELRKQLEERVEEASFTFLNDVMGEKEGSLSPSLSFAEEIKLLVSSTKEETDAEVLMRPQNLTVDLEQQRSSSRSLWLTGILETLFRRAGIFLLLIFILSILTFMAAGSMEDSHIDACLRLKPVCSVHYLGLPPF